jgi:AcrR family transcriptional regulator
VQGRALSEPEARETRDRLARIAAEILDAEGRVAVSLRRVGAAAGMSRSTPYTYFVDKDALLDAVRVIALDRLCAACATALDAACDVAQRLRGVGRAYVAFAVEHSHWYDLIFEPVVPSPEHAAAAERYRALAEAPLREARDLGLVVMDPNRLGHVLWAGTHGLLALHRAGKLRHGVSFEEALADLGDTLAFGFVRRDGAAP